MVAGNTRSTSPLSRKARMRFILGGIRSSPFVLPLVVVALACAEPVTSPEQSGTTPKPEFIVGAAGSWQLYPAQSTTYTTSVQQPINADKSSNFKANGKAVIPVKFALSA